MYLEECQSRSHAKLSLLWMRAIQAIDPWANFFLVRRIQFHGNSREKFFSFALQIPRVQVEDVIQMQVTGAL